MNEKQHGATQGDDGQGLGQEKGNDAVDREANMAKRYLIFQLSFLPLIYVK